MSANIDETKAMVNVDESLFQINLYKLSDAFSTEMLDR